MIGDEHARRAGRGRGAPAGDHEQAVTTPALTGWTSSSIASTTPRPARKCSTCCAPGRGAHQGERHAPAHRRPAHTGPDRALRRRSPGVNPAPHAICCARCPQPPRTTRTAHADLAIGVGFPRAVPPDRARRERVAESSPARSRAPPARMRLRLGRAAAKDRAENVMIVDLAPATISDVVEFGSVQVPKSPWCGRGASWAAPPREHGHRPPARRRRSLPDVIRATFPPAPVTGAPKLRVMQAIEDLEPVRRGVYCARGRLGRRRYRPAAPRLAVSRSAPSHLLPAAPQAHGRSDTTSVSAAGSSPIRNPTMSGRRPS